MITSYSWCLTNRRSLAHCPQGTRKARGQRSAAWSEWTVSPACHQKLLLGQTQPYSSPAITTCGAWKQKQTTSRLCSASGGIQKEQCDGTQGDEMVALEAEPYTELGEDHPAGSNCLKHWVGNELEKIRDSKQSSWNRHSLQEIFCKQWKLPGKFGKGS